MAQVAGDAKRGFGCGRYAALCLLGLLLPTSACGPSLSEGSSKRALPWTQSLASLFDDQNDICTTWLGSSELWAGDEKRRLAQRTQQADIIAVGHVQALVRADSINESVQEGLQLEIQEMLRGVATDLPDGAQRILLPLSQDQESRITNGIIGRQAVLFLRWIPGSRPPFRWHLSCATTGVVDQTKVHLQARRKGNGSPSH